MQLLRVRLHHGLLVRGTRVFSQTHSASNDLPQNAESPKSILLKTITFDKMMDDIQLRLFQHRLTPENRMLATREGLSKELLERKNPIIVEGKKLEPMPSMGNPGRKHLSWLLHKAESKDHMAQIESVIRSFGIQKSESLTEDHIRKFLVKSAQFGRLSEASNFLFTSHILTPYKNSRDVIKEMLRLHIIIGSPIKRLMQYYDRLGSDQDADPIDIDLLMAAGIKAWLDNPKGNASQEIIEETTTMLDKFVSRAREDIRTCKMPDDPSVADKKLPNPQQLRRMRRKMKKEARDRARENKGLGIEDINMEGLLAPSVDQRLNHVDLALVEPILEMIPDQTNRIEKIKEAIKNKKLDTVGYIEKIKSGSTMEDTSKIEK